MRYDKIIRLIGTEIVIGSRGEQIESASSPRTVYGAELRIGITEHYAAATADMRPDVKLEVYTREYRGEELLRHRGALYRVIRASSVGEKTILVCERKPADADG